MHLERALESSRTIGIALGIIMARHLVPVDVAFEVLRKVSTGRNTKPSRLAREIAPTGTTAGLPDA